ncbi:MAG: histidine kinase [Actinomycetota bacterium]|nr:histidine kinase [Actinomycetota bacterium]
MSNRVPRRTGRPPIWHAVMAFGFGSVLLAADFPLVGHSALIPHPDWLRLLVLACLCALQLGRERAAVPMFLFGLPLVAVDAAMGLSLPAMIVAGDQLFTAILHGSRRASRSLVWTVFALMIAMAVAFLFIAADPRSWLLLVLQLGSLPLIPVWWAINMRQQRALTDAERERADSLAHIAVLDREAAVHAERASMARDLHDVIAGNMSAIAIQSEALLSMREGDPDTVRAVLRSVRENAVESLTEMRAMIGLLRSENVSDGFAAPARLRELERLVRSARAAGLDVHATSEPTDDLPAAVDLSAFRIVQEALTNAVKHAPGSRAEVVVRVRDGTLVVEVTNNKAGARVNPAGTGLLSMTERARGVGGRLVAGPHGPGWRVRAELPVEDE